MSSPRQEVKFQLNELLGVGFTMIVLGIGLAYGLEVMGETRDEIGIDVCGARTDGFTTYNATAQQCRNSTNSHTTPTDAEFTATTNSITSVSKLPEKLPTIATVIVAAVIIGILVTYLWARFSR
tara:strand:+ start:247 stop:618 length:372 start_codon:yes stop_codon:yes gene_type:complete